MRRKGARRLTDKERSEEEAKVEGDKEERLSSTGFL